MHLKKTVILGFRDSLDVMIYCPAETPVPNRALPERAADGGTKGIAVGFGGGMPVTANLREAVFFDLDGFFDEFALDGLARPFS